MRDVREFWYLGLLATVIAGYPLVSSLSPLLSIESRDVSILFRAVALLYSLAVGYHFFVKRRIRLGIFGSAFLFFWVMYSARLVFDTVVNPESLGRPIEEYYIFAFLVTLIPSLACYARLSAKEVLLAGKILWLMCLIAAGGVVATYLIIGGEGQSPRFELETLNPISVGHLGVTLIIMSVTLFPLLSLRFRWVALGAIGGGLVLVGVAASRGPIVSFLVALGIFYVISVIHALRAQALRSMVALSLLGIVLFVLPVFLFGYIEDELGFGVLSRLEAASSGGDESTDLRKISFQGAWDQFLGSPILGDALEEKTTRFYPHNNILEAFMAAGILGGTMMVILYVISFVNAIRLIASRSAYTWIGVVLLQYLVGTQFSGAIWSSDALFCLMAVASVSVRAVQCRHSKDVMHFKDEKKRICMANSFL